MRTFADLMADTTAGLADPALTGIAPGEVAIEVDLQGVGAQGGLEPHWSTVAAGVACAFVDRPADKVSISREDLWPAGLDKPAALVTRVVSFGAAPTYVDPDDGATTRLLDARCSLLYVDRVGVAHRYRVVACVDVGEQGQEWRATVQEVVL